MAKKKGGTGARNKGGRRKGDATPAAKIARAERIAEALDYRRQGFTFTQIAEAMGISYTTAYTYVTDALKAIVEQPAADVKKLMIERLDAMMQTLFVHVAAGTAGKDTIDAILRIEDRRAKWLGLDIDESTKRLARSTESIAASMEAYRPVLRPDAPIPANPVL